MSDRERAEALWQLLDDIDTLDDACRSDDAGYRRAARAIVAKRFKHFETDGYKLYYPGEMPPRDERGPVEPKP